MKTLKNIGMYLYCLVKYWLIRWETWRGHNGLVEHYLGWLRAKKNCGEEFQRVGKLLSALLIARLEMDIYVRRTVMTPMDEEHVFLAIDYTRLFGISIRRAGDVPLEAFKMVFRGAPVGSVDLHRSHEPPFNPIAGDHDLPENLVGKEVVILDPMVATAGSAIATADEAKKRGAKKVYFVGWVGCPEGLWRLVKAHPDMQIVLAAVDRGLNEKAYIVGPGFGDAGDRAFGPRKD